MSIERLPFERRPRNSIANNLGRINELVDWVNQDTHLWASASGERVTVADESSLKGLTVNGRSVQDGTPMPDAPVPVQVVEGPLSLVIGDASVPINLQGKMLASLPDGTRDELHVDSTGHVTVEKNVGLYVFDGTQSVGGTTGTAAYYTISTITDIVSPPQLAPSPSSPHAGGYTGWCDKYAINDDYVSSNPIDNTVVISSRRFSGTNRIAFYDSTHTLDNATWIAYVSANPITLYYPYSEPQYIDLGYIDPPAIPSGSVVTVSASLTPEFTLEWWVDDGITALVDDIIAYVDYKTEG